MLKIDTQSRLYCAHYVPSNIDCSDCHANEKDYRNRPLYAPLYVSLSNLSNVLDNSELKLPKKFYISLNEYPDNLSNDCIDIKTKNGLVRIPRSNLVDRSCLNESIAYNNSSTIKNSTTNSQEIFPNDFQKNAHRYTRSSSRKTKPEESSFAQMQPLPKLIKRPGYLEICCKNICWPTHQLCLCCGRNTAKSCRKWSKSKGEYNYINAFWSSCALCSDDAYKILNTPVIYNEKIIDPEVLLPLDAELLYYSIQSAKCQQEKQQNSSAQSIFIQRQSETANSRQDVIVPFTTNINDRKEFPSTLKNQENDMQSISSHVSAKEQSTVIPLTRVKSLKQLRKAKSSKTIKAKKSSKSTEKKKDREKSDRPRSRSKSKSKSSRSKRHSKSKSDRSRSRSKSKSSRSKGRSKRESKSEK